MSVSFEKSIPQEVLCHILSFCSPVQNVRNTEVCRTWRDVASEVAKKQLIAQFQQDIQSKAANFLQMVSPQTLEFYCPSYAALSAVKSTYNAHAIEAVHQSITNAMPLKHTVCISRFFRVNPECPNIPPEMKEDIAGKVFLELIEMNPISNDGNTSDAETQIQNYRFCRWKFDRPQPNTLFANRAL